MYHHPTLDKLPTQGWKIHISAYPIDTLLMTKILVRHLVSNNINFKFFHNLSDYYRICTGIGEHYTQAGKFFTIYPKNYNDFIKIIVQLVKILEGFSGPKIVFDNNIPSTCIYYRYGVIRGTIKSKIVDLNGIEHLDDRTIYKPHWINDPLGDEIYKYKTKETSTKRIPSRYEIKKVLSQRAKGGVYEALDKKRNSKVIIKEGRRYGERDLFGVSGFDRIMNEVSFYKRFGNYENLPDLIDCFTILDCAYIVIEKIEVITDKEINKAYIDVYWQPLVKFINNVHDSGFIFRDIKKDNLIFSKNKIFMIDFETVSDITWEQSNLTGTVAYKKEGEIPSVESDNYALYVTKKQITYNISNKSLVNNYSCFEKIIKKIEKRTFDINS